MKTWTVATAGLLLTVTAVAAEPPASVKPLSKPSSLCGTGETRVESGAVETVRGLQQDPRCRLQSR